MFELSSPPLLVQPIDKKHIPVFSPDDGYSHHILNDDLALIGYTEGWIMPLTSKQRAVITDPPLIMVKNSGMVTARTTTSAKGFAHVFCTDSGKEITPIYRARLFSPKNDSEWLFVRDTITMIWFQYGEKVQLLGDSAHDAERFYYGKLLIRQFDINESLAPGFDKKADVLAASTKLLHVGASQIYSGGWNINNDNPGKCLDEIIAANHLSHFSKVVYEALAISSGM